MSLFEDIKDLGGGGSFNKEWWRSQLIYGLQAGTPQVGRMVFFSYNAKYGEQMQFWDRYPLVFILGEDSTRFWGANLHYLPPSGRASLGESLFQEFLTYLLLLTINTYDLMYNLRTLTCQILSGLMWV